MWPKNLLSSFVPEISNVISGRKIPKTVLGETLKKSASKTIASTTSVASSKRVDARAYISKKTKCMCIWDCATGCHAEAQDEGGGRRAGKWRAMEPVGTAWGAGRRLGGEHETIKWKKSLIGKSLLREVGPIYSLVWRSTTSKELDKQGTHNEGRSDEYQ